MTALKGEEEIGIILMLLKEMKMVLIDTQIMEIIKILQKYGNNQS